MRTLFEKGFTARFKTQAQNNIYQLGGCFMIGLSLRKVFAFISIKEINVFILYNIVDNIFPQIFKDIKTKRVK